MTPRLLYDRKTRKLFMITAIVSLSVFILSVIFSELPVNPLASEADGPVLLFIFTGLVSFPAAILSAMLFISSDIYIRRLTRNGFTVPYTKAEVGGLLSNVPRTGENVTNRYRSDSITGFYLALTCYAVFIGADILYLLKWKDLEADSVALFVLMLIGSSVFLIPAFIFFRQRNPDRYIDNVDLPDGRTFRRVRTNIFSIFVILLVMSFVCGGAYLVAGGMTRSIYKSRRVTGYDEFLQGAQMRLTSEDFTDGRWNDSVTGCSPQLSFEPVEGASYYVIFMDGSRGDYPVIWYQTNVTQTDLAQGAAEEYVWPEEAESAVLYVFALEGDPDSRFPIVPGSTHVAADYLYGESLDVKEYGDVNIYGNVLSYGYLSGTVGN